MANNRKFSHDGNHGGSRHGNDGTLDELVALTSLLSDRTRLRLLMLLADGEKNVKRLGELLTLPQPTVSHHLGLMRLNGAIINRRVGKEVYYSISDDTSARDKEGIVLRIDGFELNIRSATTVREEPHMDLATSRLQ